jgi:hypothetical protein
MQRRRRRRTGHGKSGVEAAERDLRAGLGVLAGRAKKPGVRTVLVEREESVGPGQRRNVSGFTFVAIFQAAGPAACNAAATARIYIDRIQNSIWKTQTDPIY